MAEKYYAVKKGMKTGIFYSWEECRANVHGYPGALYKSFKTREEALAYLGEDAASGDGNGLGEKTASAEKDTAAGRNISGTAGNGGLEGQNCVKIYVDGSYNGLTEEFSYGMVVLLGGREEKFNCKFNDKELAAMHNVAGEIKGAEAAMQYALDRNLAEIEIYHDYEGIARWCLGEWKTNKEGTKAYKAFYDKACRQVDIRFVKVAGHSNDKYNDMADELAKEALGIK